MTAAGALGWPLSTHGLDDSFAFDEQGPISTRQYLADVLALAERMRREWPDFAHVLNYCHNRYRFTVAFGAALVAGKTALLPPNDLPHTVTQLRAELGDMGCLYDEAMPQGPRLSCLNVPHEAAEVEAVRHMPEIAGDHLAAIVFTSGSTGKPSAHRKTWGKLCQNARAESRALGVAGWSLAATVPPQHMYGFESSVLLALQGGAALWHGKPFYPADIARVLARLPRPRLLVSTPFHLSAALDAGLAWPPCDAVLSATAPLHAELARRVEVAFGAPVLEIYGSTETSQTATRRTLDGPAWTLLDGVRITQGAQADGAGAWVEGGHVEGRVPLADIVRVQADGRFVLVGRQADMVNVAGKRSSIAFLNQQLLAIAGVRDGCFFQPGGGDDEVGRLCAFVVAADELTNIEIVAALRQRVDPLFLPRPLFRVPALPRTASSKLPREALAALHARCVDQQRAYGAVGRDG